MEDPSEALDFWRALDLRSATALHLTRWPAVSDRGFSPAAAGRLEQLRPRSPVPGGRVELEGVDARNFMVPALLEGRIEHLIWVLPSEGHPENPLEWARMELQEWLDLDLEEYASLREHEGRVEGRLLGGRITLCRIDYLPVLSGPVVLHLDVSYMLDTSDRVWILPSDLARQVSWIPACALSVSHSIRPGFVPPRYRYLGELAWRLLGGELAPDEAARLRAVDEELGALRASGATGEGFEALLAAQPGLPPWLQAGVLAAAAEAAREGPDGPRGRRARELDPACAGDPLIRARMLSLRGRLEEALEAWREVEADRLAQGPLARLAQTDLLGRLERWEEAGLVLQGLVADATLPVELQTAAARRLAQALTRQGRLDEALQAHRSAAGLEGGSPSVLRELGMALARAGRPDEAEGVFRQAIRKGPSRLGTLEAHLELAHLYRLQGREEQARVELSEARRKDRAGLYSLEPLARKAGS